jgi:hemolysin activation/secretion protein
MTFRSAALAFLLVPCVVWTGAALAQGVPPSGAATVNPGLISKQNRENERQIQEQTKQPSVGPAVVGPSGPQTVIGPAGGATFLLKAVVFDKSAFISKEEFDAIAAPYIGKKVDLSQVQRIVKAVNDIYADRGLITASAYLPTQNLNSGTLHVGLVEGRLGKLTIKGNKRLKPDFILGHVPTQPGAVVDVPQLSRSIAAFNKTGVAQFQAALQPGVSFGLTDINLAVLEPPALQLDIFGDNQGVESVNRYEGGFLLQGYAPLGIDDRLTLYGVGSEGNINGNIAYSIPFNLSGGRIGVSYTQGAIRVVDGPFVGLDIKGQSRIASANLAQPVYVDANWFFIGNTAIAYDVASSTQTSIQITDNRTTKETVGFSVGYSNQTLSLSISPTYSAAQTAFQVTDTSQRFSLYNASYAGSLRLPADFVATLGGAFQISSAQLIAGDQLFQLGGPTTVRGYSTGIVAGASGYFGNLELHHGLDFVLPGLSAFGFYDRGTVYSTSPSEVTLNSVGAGVAYDFKRRVIGELSIGFPLSNVVSNQAPYEIYFRVTTKFSSADLASLN